MNYVPALSTYRGPSKYRGMHSKIISEVIECIGTSDMKVLRKELRLAYPHVYRSGHKYYIWLDEIKRHLGEKPPLNVRKPTPKQVGQRSLFPMTPGEILGAELVKAGEYIKWLESQEAMGWVDEAMEVMFE